MGMATRLYGCIVEYGLSTEKRSLEVYRHNEQIINNLPEDDEWPPLTKNMFSITQPPTVSDGLNYQYSGRIIHFGANFKSIEYEWKEWKDKFEDLLTKLYWLNADVHFKTEYSSIQTFQWDIDLSKWHIEHNENILILPIKNTDWNFEGDDSWGK